MKVWPCRDRDTGLRSDSKRGPPKLSLGTSKLSQDGSSSSVVPRCTDLVIPLKKSLLFLGGYLVGNRFGISWPKAHMAMFSKPCSSSMYAVFRHLKLQDCRGFGLKIGASQLRVPDSC